MTEKEKLRQIFFKDHVQKDSAGMAKIATAPHDLFEWFYENNTSPVSISKRTDVARNDHE